MNKGYSIVGIATYEWAPESEGKYGRQIRKDYTLQKGDSVFECQERRYIVRIKSDNLCSELVANHER